MTPRQRGKCGAMSRGLTELVSVLTPYRAANASLLAPRHVPP